LARLEYMTVLSYVLFKVNSGTEREVCQKIVTFDEVLEADVIFGEYDVVAKISAADLDALEDFLSQKLRNVPSIVLTSTMLVGREYKGKSQRPKSK
jgi:DNA-binding Lrp family transcriptional regulator